MSSTQRDRHDKSNSRFKLLLKHSPIPSQLSNCMKNWRVRAEVFHANSRYDKSNRRYQLLFKELPKIFQISNCMKTDQYETRSSTQTDMTKLIVAFSSYLNTFSKNSEMSNFMKLRPVPTDAFHADRQSIMKNLLFVFRI